MLNRQGMGTTDLYARIDRYISDRFVAEDDALLNTLASIGEAGMPGISVTGCQGKLLHLFATLVGAKRILEIGTLGGYSTIWLARALPPEGRLISLELNDEHAAVARENLRGAGLAETVELRVGPALSTLPALKEEGQDPFDLVFIDADKPTYLQYFQFALALSRPGTLIIADNVIRQGAVLSAEPDDRDVEGVQRLNDFLAHSPEVTATILPTVGTKGVDGMALARVR